MEDSGGEVDNLFLAFIYLVHTKLITYLSLSLLLLWGLKYLLI
jgi:hypothetical protein